jgi:hypothetical protein
MTNTRSYVVTAALMGASAMAACSSSTATGPSSASLARIFDSAYVADSTAGDGLAPRALIENYLALFADEGLTPVSVQVNTDSGTLPMHMMAALSFDTTAAGAPADSLALVIGWTSDYSKYLALITEAFTPNGPRVGRVRVTSGRFRALESMLRGNGHPIHAETPLADLMPLALMVEGETFDVADSASGSIVWGGSGSCTWQHVPVSRFDADSTFGCSRVGVSLDFAFHFPGEAGIDPSLSHMSMPSRSIPGVRLVGFDGF